MIKAGEPLVAREPFGAAEAAVPPASKEKETGSGRGGLLTAFIRDFYGYSRPLAPKTALFLALGTVVEGVGLLLLVPLLGVVLGGGSGSEWLDRSTEWLIGLTGAESRLGRLTLVLALFGLVVVMRGFVIRTRDVLLAKLQVGFVESQRLKIIQLLTGSRWEATTRLRHGRIMHVLGGDIDACGDGTALLLHAVVALTLLTGHLLLMFLLSWKLAAFILALLIVGGLAVRPLLKRAQRLGQSLTNANLMLVSGTSQFLGGLKLALSQDLQLGFLRSFQSTLRAAAERRVAFVRQRTEAQLLITTAGAVVASLVILGGIGLFATAPATLLAFLFVLSRMVAPLSQIQMGVQQVFHTLPAYEKVKQLQAELTAAQTGERIAAQAISAAPAGPIAFREVSFWHGGNGAGEGQGLYDLNLTIEEGAFVGLVGPSGAGKTTFCDLIVGLYPPRRGRISVAGSTLEGRTLAAWRASLSYVSQDPFLFHDSIRANLLWARPDASEAQLWKVLELAGADAFVRLLPDGLETIVGERGGLVSGGERQRLALARALLREPKLLVLDEATNAIDVAAERVLLERLRDMAGRATIMMVAHRDASLQFCERLIELRDGRVVGDQ
jgi:ATP-binding cassette, subfamily C, bacterial